MRVLATFFFSLIVSSVNCFRLSELHLERRYTVSTISGGAIRSPLFRKQKLSATITDDDDKATGWTKPRIHNNPVVRSVVLLGALAATGISTPFSKLPSTALASVHLLSFAVWFGTVFYTTFIAGLTMFKNLPRQTFGRLQSKLFPKYFSLCSLTLVLQLITVNRLSSVSVAASKVLGFSLVMTLLNQFWLEPNSSKIMFNRYELENQGDKESSEYKELAASFGKLHGISSLTNLLALVGGVVHGVYLSSVIAVV